MGGNALKNVKTVRLSRLNYQLMVSYFTKMFEELSDLFEFKIPKQYKNKDSFGDLDIVICYKKDFNLRELVTELFKPNEIVKNGDCLSFDFQSFQIDLITASKENFQTTYDYLSWNDLGNLIGRIAHKMGLKFGHKGLSYTLSDKDGYDKQDIILTKNIYQTLKFLGFNLDSYSDGFYDLEDIFNFVVSSQYFNPEIYLYYNLNHTNRVRNKKRDTYIKFVDHILKFKDDKGFYQFKDKESYIPKIQSFFNKDVSFAIKAYNQKILESKNVKLKFNGLIVKDITKLEGKNLGKFISYFKSKFIDFNTFIINSSQDMIEKEIFKHFLRYNAENFRDKAMGANEI